MITMLLGGLWHGAAWGFVLWGGIHGTALVIEHQFRGREVGLPGWLKWFITFHVVVLAWIVFRAPELSVAGELFSQLTDWGEATAITWTTAALVAATIGLQLLPGARDRRAAAARRAAPPRRDGRRARRRRDVRGGDGADAGRATLHLLRLLT